MSEDSVLGEATLEAWEQLAPEIPPNWKMVSAGPRGKKWAPRDPCFEMHGRWPKTDEGRRRAAMHAWAKFGIARKQYAEDIAVRLVREAAQTKWGGEPFSVKTTQVAGELLGCDGVNTISIRLSRPDGSSWAKFGITLCDAALACIRELEAQS